MSGPAFHNRVIARETWNVHRQDVEWVPVAGVTQGEYLAQKEAQRLAALEERKETDRKVEKIKAKFGKK